jgi:FkbM family methyltransferase
MKLKELIKSTSYPVGSIHNFSKVVIYGAGNMGREVLKILKKHSNHEVVAFIDRSASKGLFVGGIPVLHPEENALPKALKSECLAIAAVFNRDVNLVPIVSLLKEQGFGQVISFVQFHHFFSDQLGDKFWLGNIDKYKSYIDQIEEIKHLLEDKESKLILESNLKYRLTGDADFLIEPEGLDTQYFSKTLERTSEQLRFIDGGAYDGDTLLAMQKLGVRCEAVASFEPDLLNFNKLVEFSKKNRGRIAEENYLFPCAVWSKTEYLKFNSESTEASSVNEIGTNTILGVAIDHIIPNFRPNFIKMDIEGAEIDGLLGARATINEFRPRLGICLYHTPQHLWEIPLLIKSWDLNYKFYIRSHGSSGFDLVLYAIPREG